MGVRIITLRREGGVADLEDGIDGADKATPRQFAELFASEDLRKGIESFLSEGLGKATFEGR